MKGFISGSIKMEGTYPLELKISNCKNFPSTLDGKIELFYETGEIVTKPLLVKIYSKEFISRATLNGSYFLDLSLTPVNRSKLKKTGYIDALYSSNSEYYDNAHHQGNDLRIIYLKSF